jgi:hypothetical protein
MQAACDLHKARATTDVSGVHLHPGVLAASAPVLSARMRMVIIYRPGSALFFLQSALTSRRIKICFNSNSNSNSKNMAPCGPPASRVVEPYCANRQSR